MNRAQPTPAKEPYTVYLVEDDPFVRGHMDLLFESIRMPVVSFETAAAFLNCYRESSGTWRGCLLLDHKLPEMTGMELFELLNSENCLLPVVMVTGNATVPLAVQATRTGIFEFLEKPIDPERLVEIVRRAFVENERRVEEWKRRTEFRRRLTTLTPKETEVFDLMVTGLPTKVLAYRLGISDRTAEKHRQKVMHKLHARNLLDLVYIAQECGMVQDLGRLREKN